MVGLRVAGTVCHMGGHVDFTLCSRVKHWDRLWSSAVKGEGDSVGVVLLTRATLPPLWIADQVRNDGHGHDTSTLWFDESPMNLYEILGFQPKGVATLSFSSR